MAENKNVAEYKNIYHEQIKIALVNFLLELCNFAVVSTSAIMTRSLIVLIDFVDSLSNVLKSGFVFFLCRKLCKNLKYEFNYGIGKIEAIASFGINVFIFGGILSTFIFSIKGLINPTQPSSLLFYVVFIKMVNVAGDTAMIIKQKQIQRQKNTAIVESELAGYIKDFAFDTIALLAILVSYLLRNNKISWYFSPIVCIAIGILLAVRCVKRIVESVSELTDKTLSEDVQMKIIKIIGGFRNDYDCFNSVNSHKSGNDIIIDIDVTFSEAATYSQIQDFVSRISNTFAKEIEGSRVSVQIKSQDISKVSV